jgi:hypothetical protein
MMTARNLGRVLGVVTAAALAGCGAPEPGEPDPAGEVATNQAAVSVCNQLGLPDPGTCSSCQKDAAGSWVQTCVTIECNFVQRSCAPPIVSCGACGYRFLSGFVQTCTRADGTTVTQSCQPAYLPPPGPQPIPRLP